MTKPSKSQALAAVRTLLEYIGENPDREGLVETPERVLKTYGEFFCGYAQNPAEILNKKFGEMSNYNDMVLVKDIDFISHCEHHMQKIIGKAHVAYLPTVNVVGLSKLARLVDVFAKRLQVQERMTAQIAQSLWDNLKPRGVAVLIEARHECMSARGVFKPDALTTTRYFLGEFESNATLQSGFLNNIKS